MSKIFRILFLPVIWMLPFAIILAFAKLGVEQLGFSQNIFKTITTVALDLFYFSGAFYIAHKEGLIKKEHFTGVKKEELAYFLSIFALMLIPLAVFDTIVTLPDFFAYWEIETNTVSFIFLAVLFAPIAEEVLFRGIVTQLLLNKYHPTKAIIISALIFALIHVNPSQIPGAFVMGLLFGWIFHKTGSLIPCIIMHFINNAIACLPNTEQIDSLIQNNSTIAIAAAILATAASLLLFKWINLRLAQAGSNRNI